MAIPPPPPPPRQIQAQSEFLERCLEQWEEFEKLYERSEMWLGRAERLVGKETYGYTLKEADVYMQEVKVRGARPSVSGCGPSQPYPFWSSN